jgi:hypothetical protein
MFLSSPPNNWHFYDVLAGAVYFEVPMDKSSPLNCVSVEGGAELESAGWSADGRTLSYEIRPLWAGPVRVVINSAGIVLDEAGSSGSLGARAERSHIGLNADGLDEPDGYVRNMYSDYTPVAEVSHFGATNEGGEVAVRWRTLHQTGTAEYLVDGGSSMRGPFEVVATVQVQSDGEYEVRLPIGTAGFYRLREVEVDGDTLVHFSDAVGSVVAPPQ